MASTKPIEILLEAQGAKPNFRYDIIQPLVHGRVQIEGVSLTVAGAMEAAGQFENPKFKNGDFGLLDTNVGDILPAIDAGWGMVALPVLIKRKPIYNYIWVRADRGIESPKDLEGSTFATGIWGGRHHLRTRHAQEISRGRSHHVQMDCQRRRPMAAAQACERGIPRGREAAVAAIARWRSGRVLR
jgi:hypothetical protein